MTDVRAVALDLSPQVVVTDVTVSPAVRTVAVAVGPPGPAGPVGDTGGLWSAVADGALSGHRAVAWSTAVPGRVVTASQVAAGQAVRGAAGVTTGAAADGGTVYVRSYGALTEPSWTWTPGVPVWVGVDGALTQTVPSGGVWAQVLGVAVTATRMWVDIGDPVTTQ